MSNAADAFRYMVAAMLSSMNSSPNGVWALNTDRCGGSGDDYCAYIGLTYRGHVYVNARAWCTICDSRWRIGEEERCVCSSQFW